MELRVTEKKIASFILTTGVTLNYIADAFNKIAMTYFPVLSRSAIVYRLMLQLFCIIVSLFFLNKKRLNWLLIFIFFALCTLIGNLSLKYVSDIDINLIEQFIYFNKYFFIFFIFFAVSRVLEERDLVTRFTRNFIKIYFFNGYLSLLGLIVGIEFFSISPIRFGYVGLIKAANEASVFYLLGLFVVYYDWNYFKKSKIKLLLVILFCAISGLKAVYLGMVLLLLFHIISRLTLMRFLKISAVLVTVISVIVLNVSKLKEIFGYYYYFFMKRGFVYMFTGGRNTFIESRVLPFLGKYTPINYLFGGQNISNVDDFLVMTEMDFVDVFLFFGIINGLFYLYCYKKYIVGVIQNNYFKAVVLIFFFLAFFAGHFFTTSVNPIYIIIVFSYLNYNFEKI